MNRPRKTVRLAPMTRQDFQQMPKLNREQIQAQVYDLMVLEELSAAATQKKYPAIAAMLSPRMLQRFAAAIRGGEKCYTNDSRKTGPKPQRLDDGDYKFIYKFRQHFPHASRRSIADALNQHNRSVGRVSHVSVDQVGLAITRLQQVLPDGLTEEDDQRIEIKEVNHAAYGEFPGHAYALDLVEIKKSQCKIVDATGRRVKRWLIVIVDLHSTGCIWIAPHAVKPASRDVVRALRSAIMKKSGNPVLDTVGAPGWLRIDNELLLNDPVIEHFCLVIGIEISNSRKGRPGDNTLNESAHRTLQLQLPSVFGALIAKAPLFARYKNKGIRDTAFDAAMPQLTDYYNFQKAPGGRRRYEMHLQDGKPGSERIVDPAKMRLACSPSERCRVKPRNRVVTQNGEYTAGEVELEHGTILTVNVPIDERPQSVLATTESGVSIRLSRIGDPFALSKAAAKLDGTTVAQLLGAAPPLQTVDRAATPAPADPHHAGVPLIRSLKSKGEIWLG